MSAGFEQGGRLRWSRTSAVTGGVTAGGSARNIDGPLDELGVASIRRVDNPSNDSNLYCAPTPVARPPLLRRAVPQNGRCAHLPARKKARTRDAQNQQRFGRYARAADGQKPIIAETGRGAARRRRRPQSAPSAASAASSNGGGGMRPQRLNVFRMRCSRAGAFLSQAARHAQDAINEPCAMVTNFGDTTTVGSARGPHRTR